MTKGDELVPESRVLLHNLRGLDLDSWVHEYEVNEGFRKRCRSNSVLITHEIIS